jgi:hypothetical protein
MMKASNAMLCWTPGADENFSQECCLRSTASGAPKKAPQKRWGARAPGSWGARVLPSAVDSMRELDVRRVIECCTLKVCTKPYKA